MSRLVGRWCLLLLAACLPALTGCRGVNQDPNCATCAAPSGNLVSFARPPGLSYFRNGGTACRLEVLPIEATNPVRTQHVFVATVHDGAGQPARKARVEWMLEGVGNIVDVDGGGFVRGRGQKIDNRYAVSYTDSNGHVVTRGNEDPSDDITICPGQTWCVISSAIEGDSHVTVYCPEICNWDAHKVFVTKHWIDAEWIFPKPAINRAGTEHVFTTTILRHSDKQPLANYRVRYRIVDGPPGFFLPGRTQEMVVPSDLNGQASVTLAQVAPVMGLNRIAVEIIRPPDPASPAGVGIVVGRGETTKEWQAPAIALDKVGPATAPVGQELTYNLTVTNIGKVESRSLTVVDPIPDSLEFIRSDPPANRDKNDLIWTLGELPPGQARTLQLVFRSTRVGTVVNVARVETEEGLKDQKEARTEIVAPGLKVTKTGPASGIVNVPINYDITVTNAGGWPAQNVVLHDEFDAGLEHETKANPIELPVGTLGPRESKTVKVILIPRRTGVLINRVVATADGGLRDQAQHPVTVQEAKLTVVKRGPTARYLGRPAEWVIEVTNPGEVPLNNVVVRDMLPPELAFESASDGGRRTAPTGGQPPAPDQGGGEVVWGLGTLQPREARRVQLVTKCVKMAREAVNVAVASADPGLEVESRAALEIRGLPAFRLEVVDLDDPVEMGAKTTYKIDVTNQGSLAGNRVEILAVVPPQMRVVNATGPVQPKIDGNRVVFPPVDALGPQQMLSYSVEVQAIQVGDVRFRVELRSATLSDPVIEEESTNIYAPPPASLAAPAPVSSSAPRPAAPVPPAPAAMPLPVPTTPTRPAPSAPPLPVPSGPPVPAAPPTPSGPLMPPPPPAPFGS